MDGATLTTLISSVGFPIVASIGLFWYMTNQMQKRDEKIDETLKKITEVVNENNKIVATFTEKMDIVFKLIEQRYDDKEDK